MELTFGTVLVGIGIEGVPDDVHVVCLSRLARESHRKEIDIVMQMQDAKKLLLTEDNFIKLLTWLADEIMAGRKKLPFKPERPARIQPSQTLIIAPKTTIKPVVQVFRPKSD